MLLCVSRESHSHKQEEEVCSLFPRLLTHTIKSNKRNSTLGLLFLSHHHISSFQKKFQFIWLQITSKEWVLFQPMERHQENSYKFKTKHLTYVSPFQNLSVMQDQGEPGLRHIAVSGPLGKKLVNVMSYNLPRSHPLLGGSDSPPSMVWFY